MEWAERRLGIWILRLLVAILWRLIYKDESNYLHQKDEKHKELINRITFIYNVD